MVLDCLSARAVALLENQSGHVADSVSIVMFQLAIDPQCRQRPGGPRKQVETDVSKPEIGGQPQCDQRCESRSDQPSDVRGERGAGIAVSRFEARIERTGRLPIGEAQQAESNHDEYVLSQC